MKRHTESESTSHKRGRYKRNTKSQESNMEVKRQSKTDKRIAKQVHRVKSVNYSVQIRENTDQKKNPYLDPFHAEVAMEKSWQEALSSAN